MADEVTRTCRTCGQAFSITPAEAAFFEALRRVHPNQAWSLPRRCAACRADRRHERLAVVDDGVDERLQCRKCHAFFTLTAKTKTYLAARHWAKPKTCWACRHEDPGVAAGACR